MKTPTENDSTSREQRRDGCMARIVRLSDSEARYIEGYAAALQDAMAYLTGENGCSKSYDPMTVSDDGKTLHSYAFDMLDGGRHHPVSDYKNAAEIKDVMLLEVVRRIREDYA